MPVEGLTVHHTQWMHVTSKLCFKMYEIDPPRACLSSILNSNHEAREKGREPRFQLAIVPSKIMGKSMTSEFSFLGERLHSLQARIFYGRELGHVTSWHHRLPSVLRRALRPVKKSLSPVNAQPQNRSTTLLSLLATFFTFWHTDVFYWNHLENEYIPPKNPGFSSLSEHFILPSYSSFLHDNNEYLL